MFPSSALSRADAGPRVLLLSMRQLAALVGYCALYEFEDVVAALASTTIVSPDGGVRLEGWRRAYRAARVLTASPRLASRLCRPFTRPVAGTYDLFLACFNHPYELFALASLRGWRSCCGQAICYIAEAWPQQLPEYLVELLTGFDHVFVGVRGATEQVQRITGRPCSYVPFGVDALAFCPHPTRPGRAIDVAAIGRRSEVTHQALLQLARRGEIFYYYDTIRSGGHRGLASQLTFRVSNHREHRQLLASLLMRTRYFLASRAWADEPSMSAVRDVIGSRFYEGAAAGTVMLGSAPSGPDFDEQFGWPDSVVEMPFHAPDVGERLAALNADPHRLGRIRRDNVVNALRQHDWAHRWRQMLCQVGLPASPELLAREAQLEERAAEVLLGDRFAQRA